MLKLGVDIGSTTIKCAVVNEAGTILYSSYERHKSCISEKLASLVKTVKEKFPAESFRVAISGSAGMGIADDLGLPFIQEVYATRLAVKRLVPDTDVVIELGGEDAKILFLSGATEVRMNGSCAGGTGAFIDQMAELMSIPVPAMNEMAFRSQKTYTIASRCGVFAKSDIQPLLNQGAQKEDVAASIFYAVVNQTIAGLAQSREIEGNILYLGGPLTFSSYLRFAFDHTLKNHGVCPENSLFFVSYGAAISDSAATMDLSQLLASAESYSAEGHSHMTLRPLFKDEEEIASFRARHEKDSAGITSITAPDGPMFLGIDAGSTTVKAVLVDEKGNLFNTMYVPNSGNPVPIVKGYLEELYKAYPAITVKAGAVTGYGEDIIREAFGVDYGIVETIAHYTAAKKFCPEVDFIIDIGGQDIKCFRIRNGAIDSIFLNEACSSGCGSFLQTFAGVLGFSVKDFASKALRGAHPVDLGSRCTVFMNSSVKQAQKDGVSIEDISAGLSYSVVRNALYKVIRTPDPSLLGQHIVVQGGTFLNDAVLRAFELETKHDCLRPSVSGLMGAYGAALYAKERAEKENKVKSGLISPEDLAVFSHSVKALTCNGCNNHCHLTVNDFGSKKRFIAGNRCGKPLGQKKNSDEYNLYAFKYHYLDQFRTNERVEGRETIGIPMGLNNYELLPFWHTFWTQLGFNVVVSGESSHSLYVKGQHTIPSDTVCYPAKLIHGHMEDLFDKKVDIIFYPSMTFNLNEGKGNNHYNCPVVAYYPDVIADNVKAPSSSHFMHPYLNLTSSKLFPKSFVKTMKKEGYDFDLKSVKKAAERAYDALHEYHRVVAAKAQEYREYAKWHHLPVIVLAGRPYHIDPETNHGIDKLICSLGAVVVTEDSVSELVKPFQTTVLNQWTYHSRLYAAAKFVRDSEENINLVQLVSFGCGVDAVTTDETRAILESGNKIYTQIKIDEITNLGAVKIRLRSLFAVIDKGKES